MKTKRKSRNRDSATHTGPATQCSGQGSANDPRLADDGNDRKRQKPAHNAGRGDESCTVNVVEVDSSFDATTIVSGRPGNATTARYVENG